MNANDALKAHADLLKGWPKQAGTKPSGELLATVMALGARHGKQCMANAMYLRPEGATSGQVVMVCGAPQLNKMRAFNKAGYVKPVAEPKNGAGHVVYHIALTAKGEAKVARVAAAPADTADTGKAKPKAKKAKGKAKGGSKPKAKPAPDSTALAEPTPQQLRELNPAEPHAMNG